MTPNHFQKTFSLLDTFDFLQWVSGPTQVQGHTLDLILSRGLTVLDIIINDGGLSYHVPILFSMPLDGKPQKHSPLPHWTRIIADRSSDEFSSMYVHLSANQDMISSTYHLGADEHLRLFNANCSNILNSIAPLKVKKQTKFSTLAK